MLTLNGIKFKFINYFKNHKQVRQVEYFDQYNFAALRNLQYPVVNIEFNQSTIQDKFMVHSFNIFIGDKIQPDNMNSEDEIMSDTMQIAEDFFTAFRYDYDMDMKPVSNIQAVSDNFGDRVSGIVFTVQVYVGRLYNSCVAPVTNNLPPVQQYTAYWGWLDSNTITTLSGIQALQGSGLFVDQQDILADYTTNTEPKLLVFAEPINQPVKTKWYVSANNQGTIGRNTDDLFKAPVTISNYRYYITNWKTQQDDSLIIFKTY